MKPKICKYCKKAIENPTNNAQKYHKVCFKKHHREHTREYYRRPEVKKHHREHMREYYQRPEVKKKKREYYRRPEVKKKKREYYRKINNNWEKLSEQEQLELMQKKTIEIFKTMKPTKEND